MRNSILAITLALASSVSTATTNAQPAETSAASNAPTRQLVERFIDAYASHDSTRLARTVTRGFTARRYSTQTASSTPLSADALIRSWHHQAHSMPAVDPGNLPVAIYPTPKRSTVFVTYRVTGETGVRVALVELRGHRVAGIQDFPGSAESAPAGNGDHEIVSN